MLLLLILKTMGYIQMHNLNLDKEEKFVTRGEVRELIKEDREAFRVSFREEVKKDTKEIVDNAVGELATIISSAFTIQQKQINGLEARFDGLETSLDKKFEKIDKRFDGVDSKIAGVNNRIDALVMQK